MEMHIFGAFRRQKCAFPKFKVPNPGLTQKSKVPKWVCRSTLASFCHGQPFFAIFGPARGHIFGNKAEQYRINDETLYFFAFVVAVR